MNSDISDIDISKIYNEHVNEQKSITTRLKEYDSPKKDNKIIVTRNKQIDYRNIVHDNDEHILVTGFKYLYNAFINKVSIGKTKDNTIKTSNVINELQNKEIQIQNVITRKEEQRDYHMKEAIKFKKANNRNSSINALKKSKICANAVTSYQNMLFSFTNSINSIEQAHIHNIVVKGIVQTKKVLTGMKSVSMAVDDITDIMEDINDINIDIKEVQDEVSRMLLGGIDIDDDDLEKEFDNIIIDEGYPHVPIHQPNIICKNDGHMVINFLNANSIE
ncbi:hypothetical protein LCGC14_1288740 [marine sediment metagenome]|uniref:Uncharacterized protein n=1 Tax=marine sediment metagenome TaxID=412755 RepID=A0A0F9KT45_9ZZZZ